MLSVMRAFHETGTTYTANGSTVKTGFDHVKELGVNAIQILPMFDQDNDETLDIYDGANNKTNGAFNWGYNPLNYNAPEGIYSSNPYDGAVRIKELKALIADYTKAGINIIMDVVYNHVSSAAGSNFNILAPGYYFRLSSTGAFSNGSGCGNETASDHFMMRKFMIDSASYWAQRVQTRWLPLRLNGSPRYRNDEPADRRLPKD
jgi:pullulanase